MCELLSTLPSNSLEELYTGETCGKILILNFKHVGPKIFRMKARDLPGRTVHVGADSRRPSGS